MNLLAIETSSEYCSAAVLQGGQVNARSTLAGQTHSQLVLPMVAELLAETHLTLAQCDAIAFGAGPGSFTGLRIACSVVQGLAWGADVPVVPVGTLAALAEAQYAEQTLAPGELVLAALDARMAELYWSVLCWDGQSWQERVAPRLDRPAAVAATLTEQGLRDLAWGCGNGFDVFAAELHTLVGRIGAPRLPDARHVATLGARLFTAGAGRAARDAAPLYVRNHVAQTSAERAAVARARLAVLPATLS